MWIILLPSLALITLGILVDWRNKKGDNVHQEAICENAKPGESLSFTVEDDRNINSGYL